MTTTSEALARALEKELGGAIKLRLHASVALAKGTKQGYLTPQELTELLIPVPFVSRGALGKALNEFMERLKEAGIVIVAKKKVQDNSQNPPPTTSFIKEGEVGADFYPSPGNALTGEPVPAVPTTPTVDASPALTVRDQVLLITAESFGLAKNELIVHATRPNERQKKRVQARNIAAYLLARDFSQPTQEIAQCLGLACRSTASRLLCEVGCSIKRDRALQEIVARIRATYTLAWYNGNLSEMLKRQKVLFPTQRKEAEGISLTLREKLESMVPLVARAAVPERSKEIFLVRYGLADDSYKVKTLQETGELYDGLTRERIRQILTHVWKKLQAGGETLPFRTTEALEEAVREYESWQELIEKSG